MKKRSVLAKFLMLFLPTLVMCQHWTTNIWRQNTDALQAEHHPQALALVKERKGLVDLVLLHQLRNLRPALVPPKGCALPRAARDLHRHIHTCARAPNSVQRVYGAKELDDSGARYQLSIYSDGSEEGTCAEGVW
eukprot:8191548-Pyramimonas_sp.AAC.1